jgi:hypothetical protein
MTIQATINRIKNIPATIRILKIQTRKQLIKSVAARIKNLVVLETFHLTDHIPRKRVGTIIKNKPKAPIFANKIPSIIIHSFQEQKTFVKKVWVCGLKNVDLKSLI